MSRQRVHASARCVAALVAVLLVLMQATWAAEADEAAKRQETIKRCAPSTVDLFIGPSQAAGGIVHETGYIITAAHEAGWGQQGQAMLWNGKRYPMHVIVPAMVPQFDVALMKMESGEELTPFVLGRSGTMTAGEPITTIGNPMGRHHAVTSGSVGAVSATVVPGRDRLDGMIQMRMRLLPGNSGGPVFNDRGELIGVVETAAGSVSYAVPIDRVRDILANVLDDGEGTGVWLGMQVDRTGTPSVIGVDPGSPAEKAGVKVGDLVREAGGLKVRDSLHVSLGLVDRKVGDKLPLVLERDGKAVSVSATLGTAPCQPPLAESRGIVGPTWWCITDKVKLQEACEKSIAEYEKFPVTDFRHAKILYFTAGAHALMGDKEKALDFLKQAADAGWSDFVRTDADWRFRDLHGEPGYKLAAEIIRRRAAKAYLGFTPPAEVFGGKALGLSNITYTQKNPEGKAAGKLLWRRKGETKFEGLPLEPADKGYKAELPASATQAPFEYYLEMQETGEKPVFAPDAGPKAPFAVTPDLTPPTAVPELAAPFLKNYRITIAWKPATDDRKVAEYRVYRGSADKFTLDDKDLLARVKADALEHADNAPTPKQTAWYAVQAVDGVGREGEVRYLKVDVPGEQPPDPLKLVATPGSKCVLLSWPGELEPIVAAIEIYRGEGKDGALKKIGEVTELKTPRYIDKGTRADAAYRYAVRARSKAGLTGEQSEVATASALRYLKRINCGGPEVASDDGVPWEADKGNGNRALKSSGTSTWTVSDAVKNAGLLKNVYQTERWGNQHVTYSFDVDPGRYEVVLHFAETSKDFLGKGKRTFDIVLNGETVAKKLDVFSEAGGLMTPWQFRKTITVTGRQIDVKVAADPNGPAIKGIEIRGLSPR